MQQTPEMIGARLTAWLAALQRLESPMDVLQSMSFPDDIGPRIVWVGCSKFFTADNEATVDQDATIAPLERVCEALSLLTLLARVDFGVWRATMLNAWPTNGRLREWIQYKLPSKAYPFVVGLALGDMPVSSVATISRLQTRAHSSPSTKYTDMRMCLEEMLAAQETDVQAEDHADEYSHMRIRVCIEWDCCGQSATTITETLKYTLALVKEERPIRTTMSTSGITTRQRTVATIKPVFTIAEVAFATTVDVGIDVAGLKTLRQLAKHGVRLSHLPPLRVDLEREQLVAFVQSVRDLTCLPVGDTGKHGRGDPRIVGARTVSVSDEFSPPVVPSLLTAVQHSSFVHTVEINLGNETEDPWFEDQHDQWQWVAYSLFSRHADHKIHTLELNLDALQQVEVDAVRQVLNAENPLTMIPGRLVLEGDVRQIMASRISLIDPEWHDQTDDVVWELPRRTEPLTLRVRSPPNRSFPWWSVVLPGLGAAWVHQDDELATSTTEMPLENRISGAPPPSFPRIDIIKMSNDSMEPVANLLELIGHDTTRIDFYEHTGDRTVEDWCARALRACPRLEELQVRQAELASLQVFVDAAEAGYGRLRELLALIVPTGERADHVRVFCRALSDPSHPLSQHLRSLDLRLMVETENPNDVIEPMLEMLRENRHLYKFHLGLKLPDDKLTALKPVFQAAFAHGIQDLVSIRLAPLAIRSKLAFLSVVDGNATQATSSSSSSHRAVRRLDASVVSIVFQFAAEGRARDFRLTFGYFGEQ